MIYNLKNPIMHHNLIPSLHDYSQFIYNVIWMQLILYSEWVVTNVRYISLRAVFSQTDVEPFEIIRTAPVTASTSSSGVGA